MRISVIIRAFPVALLTLSVFAPAQENPSFFEDRVRPILKANCEACHSLTNPSGGLSLDSRESVLKGGTRGPAAQPGSAGSSLLIHAIEQTGTLKMPMGRPRLK